MEEKERIIDKKYNNFLFIGEAGSGKSEIAVNVAKQLLALGEKKVHFFDLDMTKPLFRSRDLCEELLSQGIEFHYEEQFMDAPTLVGGANRLLKDESSYVVLDAGGDSIGARAVGGFAAMTNREDTMVYYVVNPYRPWSCDLDHIDSVLGEILGVSHISLDKIHLISNPNMGAFTTTEEVLEGNRKLKQLLSPCKGLDFACVREELYEAVKEKIALPVMPVHLYLTYPWAMA